jgi:hypothetical protein
VVEEEEAVAGEGPVVGEDPVDRGPVVVGVGRGLVGRVTPVPVRDDRCSSADPS